MRHVRILVNWVAASAVAFWMPHIFDSPLLQWAVLLPGTFMHELAHYGFALLLGGSPDTFSILPSWSNGSMSSLGHITYYPNWYNAATVGLAPLLVAPAGFWLCLVGARMGVIGNALTVWAAACSMYSCIPSDVDLQGALAVPSSWPFALIILLGCTWIWWKLIKKELFH